MKLLHIINLGPFRDDRLTLAVTAACMNFLTGKVLLHVGVTCTANFGHLKIRLQSSIGIEHKFIKGSNTTEHS